jgi:predicted Na+-dependent transporter
MVGYWFAVDRVSKERSTGLLIGLCAGVTSVIADHMRKQTKGNSALRIVSIILSPIGFFALLPFSVDLAGGYFLGSSANFAFARALASLFEDSRHCDT